MKASWGRRLAECLALVALWVAIGLAARLDANAYLLAGIPLAVLFQRFVARAPLRAVWVRNAPPMTLDARFVGAALLLAIVPSIELVRVSRAHQWIAAGWCVASLGGAVGASYALRNFRRTMLKDLALCVLLAAGPFVALLVLGLVARVAFEHEKPPSVVGALKSIAWWLALYLPVTFAVEEVVFRGVLDARAWDPADGKARGWVVALVFSATWGLWHLPVVLGGKVPLALVVVSLVIVHTMVGVPLTIFWRRTGNLFVPAFAHALADAIRNGLTP